MHKWVPTDPVQREEFNDNFQKIDENAQAVTTLLAEIVTLASRFNILPTNADNHDNIINALTYLHGKGGGVLKFPTGTFNTSPVSFQGFNNIIIEGGARALPWNLNTTIKIVGTNPVGSVGLQFADTLNPNPTWKAKACKVMHIFVDCDNKCDVGINLSTLALEDVHVRRAINHGIVLEDYSYPVQFQEVYSQYNGEHGVYVRGGMTTVYSFYQCEFSYNTGYGLVVEGGASATYRDVAVQGNARGGVKISYVSGYGTYYLQGLNFDSVYTEANGTLLETDLKYEGNYALYITSYDKTNNAVLKPQYIKYSGTLNASASGKALKIDACYGCFIDANIHGTIDLSIAGVMGLEFGTKPTSGTVPVIVGGNALTSYHTLTAPYGKIYNGLLYPTRGKEKTLFFTLPSISAGQTILMNNILPVIANLSSKQYKMYANGSITNISFFKGNTNGTPVGTLNIRPKYRTGAPINDPSLNFVGFVDIVLTATDLEKFSPYSPGVIPFLQGYSIGLEITTSADYAPGFNSALMCELTIEC
jgi:hypothetical protein